MNIAEAIEVMWKDGRVARKGWNGKYMFLKIQHPTENSTINKPFIYIETYDGDRTPWVATQTDVLACDWYKTR